jgi:hypothetical protein
MSDFVNDVKFLSLTAGTLNFTIGAALSGFQKPTSAQGFVSGLVYSYSARTQAGQFESGTGICNGVTQARTTINDGSAGATVKVDFSDPPTVVLTVLSNDMLNLVAETIILGDGTVLSGLGISDATVLGAWTNNVSSYGALVTYDTGSGGPTNVNAAIQIVNYSQDAYGDGVNSFYARGTRASPVIVQDADQLGATSFYGHDGANFQLTAQIYAVVDGAPSAGSVPTAVVITSGDGVTTAEHVRVDSNGTTSISGVLSQGGGFAYLGQFNSPTYPDTGIGAAFSWNFSGGSGEVDIWNTFAQTATDDDSPCRARVQDILSLACTLVVVLRPPCLMRAALPDRLLNSNSRKQG